MGSFEDQVPDVWPPPSGEASAQKIVAPMFPLPNLFLFPGTLMPLHIFEERYRQMIEDSLDGPGRLVIAAVVEGQHDQLAGAPEVFPIAGLGEIARHERLPDGRFLIMLVGLARVRIDEISSDRLYRQVEATALEETPPSDQEEPVLRRELENALRARASKKLNLPDNIPIGHLVDLLLLRMRLPQSVMQTLYSELSIAQRARGALAEHATREIVPEEDPPED